MDLCEMGIIICEWVRLYLWSAIIFYVADALKKKYLGGKP